MKYKPRTKPYQHQVKATLAASRQRNHAFLMEPGLGKTKAAIDAACILHLKGEVDRVLVICPLDAIEVWKDELAEHLPDEFIRKLRWRAINYDKISRRSRHHRRWVYPYVAKIERFNPDLIILDESHRCKRASSNRAQALWRSVGRMRNTRTYARDAGDDGRPYVWLLTGTPNPKGWIDIFAQFRIMDDAIFGTSLSEFKDLYCEYGFGKRRFTITRYRRISEIKEKIATHSTIISGDPLDLPPQVWQNVKVPLPVDTREMYNEMVEEMLVELEDGSELTAANAGVLRTRLLQITGGYTTNGQCIHDTKTRYLRSILNDLAEVGEPSIVYCRFIAEVKAASHAASEAGYHVESVTGATPKAVRAEYRRQFQRQAPAHNTRPMCLVFQVHTGSLSITLTAAREVVFFSLPDAWDTYWQATKRIHRSGQTRRCRYRHLVAPGTVDMSVLQALRNKSDMHAELMGNPRGFFYGVED